MKWAEALAKALCKALGKALAAKSQGIVLSGCLSGY